MHAVAKLSSSARATPRRAADGTAAEREREREREREKFKRPTHQPFEIERRCTCGEEVGLRSLLPREFTGASLRNGEYGEYG